MGWLVAELLFFADAIEGFFALRSISGGGADIEPVICDGHGSESGISELVLGEEFEAFGISADGPCGAGFIGGEDDITDE